LPHIRQDSAAHPLCTIQIAIEYLGHVLDGKCFGRSHRQMPGVLDHDVDTALLMNDGRGGGIGRFLRQHVELERIQGEALSGCQCAQLIGACAIAAVHIAHGRVHNMAGLGQRLRAELADSGACTGYQNNGFHVQSPMHVDALSQTAIGAQDLAIDPLCLRADQEGDDRGDVFRLS
jgi:hypothetical protein